MKIQKIDTLRVAWVVSHPIQYYVPLFREISRSGDLELRVLYLSERGTKPYYDKEFSRNIQFDTDLISAYRHVFLRNFSPFTNSQNFFAHINPGISCEILKNSDVVIFQGWNSLTSVFGILLCILTKKRYFIRSDSNIIGAGLETSSVRRIKRALKNIFIAPLLVKCTGVLTIGIRNEEYFENMGIERAKFHRVPFSVDTKMFSHSIEGKLLLKNQFCVDYGFDPKRKIFLYVGKIRTSKGVFDLHDQAKNFPDANFVFVGDGPDLIKLEKLASDSENVAVLGFLNQSELPKIYGMADFIVLPSHHEAWGLSVNEGIAAGCIPVVSNVCGCAPELVGATSNLIFDSRDRTSFLKVLHESLLNCESDKILAKMINVNGAHSVDSSAKSFINVILQGDSEMTKNAK